MTALTDRQRDVVRAVADLTAQRGYPPTFREVAAAVGTTSTDTIARAVWHLRRAGVLRPAPTHTRCLALAPDVVIFAGQIYRIHPVSTNAPRPCPDRGSALTPADDLERKSQAMTKNIDPPHADTVQGRQMVAAIAVAKALEHNLPEVTHWIITTDQAVRGMLKPQIAWLARLHEWAHFLAPVNGEPPRPCIKRRVGSHGANVEVTSTYRGVPFCIYHMASTAELKELAASRSAS